MTNETKNKPVETLRDGYLKVAIWRNPTDNGYRYSTGPLQRSYKDKEGQWRETEFLSGHEILRGSRLLEKAYDFQLEQKKQDYEGNGATQ